MNWKSWSVIGLLLVAVGVAAGLALGPASGPAARPDGPAADRGPAVSGAKTPEQSDEMLLAAIDPNQPTDFSALRVELTPTQKIYLTGQPILVDFQLTNASDKPVLVKVPYQSVPPAALTGKHLVAGLPLEHVFSRKPQVEATGGPHAGETARRALIIHPFDDPMIEIDDNVVYQPTGPVEPIAIRPHGVVGRRLDLTKFYPCLTRAGRFSIQWRPYSDAVRSLSVELRIMNEERAIIETSQGNIEVVFLYDKAPNHVENFLDLARRNFFDGTLFHRIIDNFMIQAGDPLTKEPKRADQWGTGRGPRTLRQEFNETPFSPGVLGAARGPDVNSASCQFFIVTGQASHLNGQYTAFGRVADEESLKTALKISKVRTDPRSDRPVEPVLIKQIRVVPVSPTSQPATQPGE